MVDEHEYGGARRRRSSKSKMKERVRDKELDEYEGARHR